MRSRAYVVLVCGACVTANARSSYAFRSTLAVTRGPAHTLPGDTSAAFHHGLA
ncbi:hypothetical protein ACFUIT_40800 [Streptomyces sp. NPDC057239]|uniref:hypothetical protein n=1 Tax=Streptomyces sp. NPDC057239 TaxID=3346061 RepID=UPI0036294C98